MHNLFCKSGEKFFYYTQIFSGKDKFLCYYRTLNLLHLGFGNCFFAKFEYSIGFKKEFLPVLSILNLEGRCVFTLIFFHTNIAKYKIINDTDYCNSLKFDTMVS